MTVSTEYTPTSWEDAPSTATPVNAARLNKIEQELRVLGGLPVLGGIYYPANLVADNAADDTAVLNSALAAVATAGGGTLRLPSRQIKINGQVSIPATVRLEGSGNTRLNAAGMGSSATAIFCQGELHTVTLTGPNGTDKSAYPNNSTIGVRVQGVNKVLRNVGIASFTKGLDLSESNTFAFLGDNLAIGYCGICVDTDQSAANNGGTALTEHGERMQIVNSVIYNSKIAFKTNGSGVDLFVRSTSIDFCQLTLDNSDSFVHFTDCHIETGYAAANNNWGANVRYLMNLANTARVSVANTRFEIRDAGVYWMVNPDVGPSNFNSGFVRFDGTNTWYGALPQQTRQFQDRDMIYLGPNVASITCYSPFINKWSMIGLNLVAVDGMGTPSSTSLTISTMDIPNGATTVQRSTANPNAACWMEVRY